MLTNLFKIEYKCLCKVYENRIFKLYFTKYSKLNLNKAEIGIL